MPQIAFFVAGASSGLGGLRSSLHGTAGIGVLSLPMT
jgi:hypothetical protein